MLFKNKWSYLAVIHSLEAQLTTHAYLANILNFFYLFYFEDFVELKGTELSI